MAARHNTPVQCPLLRHTVYNIQDFRDDVPLVSDHDHRGSVYMGTLHLSRVRSRLPQERRGRSDGFDEKTAVQDLSRVTATAVRRF